MYWYDTISTVSNLLAAISLFYGLLLGWWALSKSNATKHLGETLCDEHEMGYFVAYRTSLHGLRPFWLRHGWRRVPAPPLPTLSGLIKAADDGVWTSAMLDLSDPGPEKVSWKPIYTAFFQQLAFTAQNPWADDQVHLFRFFRRIIHSFWDPFSEPKMALNRYLEGARCSLRQKYQSIGLSFDRRKAYTVTQTSAPRLSRLMLYDKISVNETNFSPRQQLINCVRPLKDLDRLTNMCNGANSDHTSSSITTKCKDRSLTRTSNQSVTQNYRNTIDGKKLCDDFPKLWMHERHRIWLLDGRPSIAVRRSEFAALALLLGLRQEEAKNMPCGSSLFGLSVTTSTQGGVDTFRINHSSRPSRYIPSMGSGYSMLWAKHLACGCLPFAVSSSWHTVYTIAMSPDLCDHIKEGRGIRDSLSSLTEQIFHLNDLPASKRPDFFTCASPLSPPGTIENQSGQQISRWAEAVAGIAFGGLAPISTGSLCEAVRFSLEGKDRSVDDFEATFVRLEWFINEVYKVTQLELPEVDVFGPRQERLAMYFDTGTVISFAVHDGPEFIFDVAFRLGRYATLIERLVAIHSSGKTGGERVDEVYACCVSEIEESYRVALQTTSNVSRANVGSDVGACDQRLPCRNKDDMIKDDLHNIAIRLHRHQMTARDCGRVASIVILAWSYTTTIWQWDNEGQAENIRKSRCWKPTKMRYIPDVSALQ